MSKIKTHKDLDVWKKRMDLVDSIYKVTKSFPSEELYSLTNQMRRASEQRHGSLFENSRS
jgi:hypothetical protein